MTRRTVAEWVQFIVVKNIDPREKGVFVRSVDGLVRELERMKEEVKACKDGMVVKERDCCVSDIESMLAMLKEQKQREVGSLWKADVVSVWLFGKSTLDFRRS